jgi:hypothetical protein
MGGIGLLKADYTRTGFSEWYDENWDYHEEFWTHPVNASKMAVSLGFGLKIRLKSKFSIRPELQLIDTTPGSGYNWGLIRVSIGMGYHW